MAVSGKRGPLAGILLSAGESARMGQLKALLPWFGRTLIEFQVQTLANCGVDQLIVVTGPRADEIEDVLAEQPVEVVHNPDYLKGKTTSIKAGLAAVDPSAEAILLLSVDQPRPPQIVTRIIKEHFDHDAPITSPRHEGRGGHPILFSARLLPELWEVDEATQGLRAVFERHRAEMLGVPVKSPIVLLDLNTPPEYRQAIEIFEERGVRSQF